MCWLSRPLRAPYIITEDPRSLEKAFTEMKLAVFAGSGGAEAIALALEQPLLVLKSSCLWALVDLITRELGATMEEVS